MGCYYRAMRVLPFFLLVVACLLSGCPGSVITPLPPGFGPGVYHGTFQAEDSGGDFTDAGQLVITVGNAGQVSATGELLGRSVIVTGLLDGDGRLDGTITDTLSDLSGRFDGQLAGTTLSGDFRLPQEDGEDLTGIWDAVFTQ
jgi:hypothetical protein